MAKVSSDKFTNDVTFVMIVSKLCNLRCKYCYELPDLANPERMTLTQIETVFRAVRAHYEGQAQSIRFAWQGGEPLLIEPEYYRSALRLQKQVFADTPHHIVNVMQSNLTVLDEERIALLLECFDGVGVSHDVVGNLRIDAAGKSRQHKTLANLERLLSSGVAVGGISVLTRQNVAHVADIYRFWRERGLPFRILPVHRAPLAFDTDMALTPEEVLGAFKTLIDLWLEDGAPAGNEVAPLTDLIRAVIARNTPGTKLMPYDKLRREFVFIIDTKGYLGGINDLLDLQHAYGNLFTTSLSDILRSEGHRRLAEDAKLRMHATCTECPFYLTACSGHPVAEGGKEFSHRDARGALVCTVTRGTLAHIERRLVQARVIDPVTGELRIRNTEHSSILAVVL